MVLFSESLFFFQESVNCRCEEGVHIQTPKLHSSKFNSSAQIAEPGEKFAGEGRLGIRSSSYSFDREFLVSRMCG